MMKSILTPPSKLQRSKRKGATIFVVMAILPVLFIMAAMAINLSYVQTVETKTQMVTDAATRAAGNVYGTTKEKTTAIAAAQAVAIANPIEGITLPLATSDFEFGTSTRNGLNQPYTFTPAEYGNAVRLTTRSFSSGAGTAPVPVLAIFGQNSEIRPLSVAAHTQLVFDVAIVVDRSGSMAYAASEDSGSSDPPAAAPLGWSNGDPVPPYSRWLDVVNSVNLFCDELEDTANIEKAALCSYHASSATHQVLTENYTVIRDSLDAISQTFDGTSTNIGDGILEGLGALNDVSVNRPWASKAVILLSDGNHNTGTDPLVAAQQAIDQGVPIHTVSFSDEADAVLMKKVADMTGGDHYNALDAAELNKAFGEIAQSLSSILTQ